MNHTVARFMTFFVHLHSYQKLLQAIGNYQVWKKRTNKSCGKSSYQFHVTIGKLKSGWCVHVTISNGLRLIQLSQLSSRWRWSIG